MTALPNPFLSIEESAAWGVITVDGSIPFPGIITMVNGCVRPIDWQVQQGIGITGAATIFKGKKLVEGIKILCELTSALHWQAWQRHYDYIKVPDATRPRIVTLKNPAFTNLPRMVFESYPEAPQYAGKRKWTAEYSLKEYKKPVKVPTGPPDPAKLDGPPKPKDAAEAALASILQRIEKATEPDKP